MKTPRNLIKRSALVVAICAGSGLVAGSAWAQGYGIGMHHHTPSGYLGSAGHFNYGDTAANRGHLHSGNYSSGYRGNARTLRSVVPLMRAPGNYTSGYRGNMTNNVRYYTPSYNVVLEPQYPFVDDQSRTYAGPMSEDGNSSGKLSPGMVLPDGAVVVSVGQ